MWCSFPLFIILGTLADKMPSLGISCLSNSFIAPVSTRFPRISVKYSRLSIRKKCKSLELMMLSSLFCVSAVCMFFVIISGSSVLLSSSSVSSDKDFGGKFRFFVFIGPPSEASASKLYLTRILVIIVRGFFTGVFETVLLFPFSASLGDGAAVSVAHNSNYLPESWRVQSVGSSKVLSVRPRSSGRYVPCVFSVLNLVSCPCCRSRVSSASVSSCNRSLLIKCGSSVLFSSSVFICEW